MVTLMYIYIYVNCSLACSRTLYFLRLVVAARELELSEKRDCRACRVPRSLPLSPALRSLLTFVLRKRGCEQSIVTKTIFNCYINNFIHK